MKLYYISDQYIEYLRSFDNKVSNNKENSRPYVGVVFEINDIKYYAALSSPKQKHKNMHNSKDFRKIKGGEYGVINFNLMIPVPSTELTPINFDQISDIQYRRLLQNQYKCIADDWTHITSIGG